MVTNNLGGIGPIDADEPVMRFAHIGEYDGMDLDLVIKVKDGENYEVANSYNNGFICGEKTNNKQDNTMCHEGGDFGQINMLRNRNTTLVFEIQDHDTNDLVELPAFVFSAFDIDQGVVEHYRVTGWKTAQYDYTNAEAFFSEDDPTYCGDAIAAGETCLYAHSTETGHGCGKQNKEHGSPVCLFV